MMAVDRSRLPALGPEPAYSFPRIHWRALSNGVRACAVEHRDVPLVSAIVLIPVGASADPTGRHGLAALTGDLLDEGCGDLGALEVHDALGRMGAQLDIEVGADATLVTITGLARFAERIFALAADMIVRPRMEAREFERVRELRLNRLVQLRDVPSAQAERAFASLLFGSHPYGYLPIGTTASLRATSLDDVTAFHRAQYLSARATIVAVGDAPADRLFALMEGAFGPWTVETPPGADDGGSTSTPDTAAHRLAIVDRAGSPQSELRIGHVGLPRSTPDYHALVTLNMVLGGQFVSRLNMNLREHKGYTYGVRTSFDFRRASGLFVMQTSVQSEATVDAVRESLAEMTDIRSARPVTRQELELGRAALTRGYPRNFETGEQIGRAAAQIALYDLPDDYFSTFVPRVLSLTPEDLTRVAAHIDPSRLTTVIVGDHAKLQDRILELGLGEGLVVAPEF
jgi:predicted Zn-dependent peptidase